MAETIGIKAFERNEGVRNGNGYKRWYYHVLVGNGGIRNGEK